MTRLGAVLGRELDEHTWQHPALKAYTQVAAVVDAFVEALREEETKLGEQLKSLAEVG